MAGKKNALDVSPFEMLPYPWKKKVAVWSFNKKQRASFYSKLSELLSHQVQMKAAITSIYHRAEKKAPSSPMTFLYKQVLDGIATHGNLCESLAPYVPVMDRVLIAAGEKSAKLDEALKTAAEMIRRGNRIQSIIMGSLAFPVFLLIAVFGMIWGLGAAFFPAIAATLPVEQWPDASRKVYEISQFVATWWFIILAIFGGIGSLIYWSMGNFIHPLRIKLDNYPPWSLYRLVQGASWLLAYSSLVQAGRQSKDGLMDIMSQSKGNKWLYQRTAAIFNKLAAGAPSVGIAMDTQYNFPDRELVYDLGDYASLANFTEIMSRIGFEWIDGSVEKIEAQAAILNKLCFMLAAAVIGLTVQSVFGIMSSVGKSLV